MAAMRITRHADGMQDILLGSHQPRAEEAASCLGNLRETFFELLWVKREEEAYKRPRLRRWGTLLEGFLLSCIAACVLIAVLDSFCALEPSEPESSCWVECCSPLGRCDEPVCHLHKNQTQPSDPVDPQCSIARSFIRLRDLSLNVFTSVFTIEYLLRLWCCVEEPQRHRLGLLRGRVKTVLVTHLRCSSDLSRCAMRPGKPHTHTVS